MEALAADGVYTPGEATFLLGLSDEQARDLSVAWRDCIGSLSHDGPQPSTAGAEWDPVLLIARRIDVARARGAVLERRADRAARLGAIAAELRGAGATEEEVGEQLELHRLAARRRFGDFLQELIAELGGEPDLPELLDRPAACLTCGLRPREKHKTRRRLQERGRTVTREVVTVRALCGPCFEAAAPRREALALRRRRRRGRHFDPLGEIAARAA